MRSLLFTALFVCTALAADTDLPPVPKADAVKKWGGAEAVVLAKLTAANYRGAGLSDPPVHMSMLSLTVGDALRGTLKKDAKVNASHSIRQKDAPKFPVGKDCIIALSQSRGAWVVTAIEEAKPADLADARAALALPIGWTVDGKKVRSPWAALGKPEETVAWKGKGLTCGFTGRPAFLVGSAAEVTVEHVKPKVEMKFGNPDGDGEYTVTVKNPTDKAIEVPALLVDARGNILWKECLVIVCQGKTYTIPGAEGVRGAVKPLKLEAGKSVSAAVNALALKGPEWPMGGYRIEFTFGLGERAVTKSFYYLSKHHDPIREKASGGK